MTNAVFSNQLFSAIAKAEIEARLTKLEKKLASHDEMFTDQMVR
jgi:hypothetical protein